MNGWRPNPANPFTFDGLVIWIGAFATIAIFSFLYRENRLFRFAEHALLGLGIGFAVAATVTDILLPKWWRPLTSAWSDGAWGLLALQVLVGLLGLMWYGLYHPKTVWIARIVMGLTIGAGAGLAFKAEINDKLPQLIATFKSPYVPSGEWTMLNNPVNNTLFVIIVLSVLSYFFFSADQRNLPLRAGAQTGRLCLMVTFGVFFGNTIMTRMSVFIERVWFLLQRWLGVA
ncbi:MAG TPA: hypothetical protein VLH79_12915 [Chthonomonadales bacterium]|nr:hypothetical protein [Chthonomonadales bacterium]